MNNFDPASIKIQRIRKSIFNDVLQYNQQVANQRKQHRKIQKQHEQKQLQRLIMIDAQQIKREEDLKRQSLAAKRQLLQQQYERQIHEKKKREEQERKNDKLLADLEVSYQEYQSKRRLYDIQRIFKRRGFKASIAETPNRRFKTEADNPQQGYLGSNQLNHKNNFMTPSNLNKKEVSFDKFNLQSREGNRDMRYRYHDSVDSIQVKESLEKMPERERGYIYEKKQQGQY